MKLLLLPGPTSAIVLVWENQIFRTVALCSRAGFTCKHQEAEQRLHGYSGGVKLGIVNTKTEEQRKRRTECFSPPLTYRFGSGGF